MYNIISYLKNQYTIQIFLYYQKVSIMKDKRIKMRLEVNTLILLFYDVLEDRIITSLARKNA